MKIRKIINGFLSIVILCLYAIALVPCVVGRIILIIPSALAYFLDND